MRRYLKNLRRKRKLTQQETADKLGVSLSYYNSIENGNRQKNMDLLLANKIAKTLHVTVSFIIREEKKIMQKSA